MHFSRCSSRAQEHIPIPAAQATCKLPGASQHVSSRGRGTVSLLFLMAVTWSLLSSLPHVEAPSAAPLPHTHAVLSPSNSLPVYAGPCAPPPSQLPAARRPLQPSWPGLHVPHLFLKEPCCPRRPRLPARCSPGLLPSTAHGQPGQTEGARSPASGEQDQEHRGVREKLARGELGRPHTAPGESRPRQWWERRDAEQCCGLFRHGTPRLLLDSQSSFSPFNVPSPECLSRLSSC